MLGFVFVIMKALSIYLFIRYFLHMSVSEALDTSQSQISQHKMQHCLIKSVHRFPQLYLCSLRSYMLELQSKPPTGNISTGQGKLRNSVLYILNCFEVSCRQRHCTQSSDCCSSTLVLQIFYQCSTKTGYTKHQLHTIRLC